MKINFEEAKKNNRGFSNTYEGKEYVIIEDADFRPTELASVVIGEDNKLYYAKYAYDPNRMLDDQDYDNIVDIELIGWCDGFYDKYDCHYDD